MSDSAVPRPGRRALATNAAGPFRNVQGKLGTSAVSADGLLTTKPGLGGTRFTFAAGGPAFEEMLAEPPPKR